MQLEQGLGFRLDRLARMLRAEWGHALEGLALTPPQAAALRGVAGCSGCSLRALARTLGADPMKAKRCIDVLESRGLVQSAHRGVDRKPRVLELTPAGMTLAARIDFLARAWEEHLAEALGPTLMSGLEGALTALEVDLGFPATREHSTRKDPR